jgi:hypothetical protein
MNVLMIIFILFNLVSNLDASLSRVINLESKSKVDLVSNRVINHDSESGANIGSVDESGDRASTGEGSPGVAVGGRRMTLFSQTPTHNAGAGRSMDKAVILRVDLILGGLLALVLVVICLVSCWC